MCKNIVEMQQEKQWPVQTCGDSCSKMPSWVMLRSSLDRGPSANGLSSSEECWAAMKDFPEEKEASTDGAAEDARDPLLRVTSTCNRCISKRLQGM